MSDSLSDSKADNQDGITVKETKRSNPAICQFYANGKWCRFGSRCRFLHQREARNNQKSKVSREVQHQQDECLNQSTTEALLPLPTGTEPAGDTIHSSLDSQQICKFYLKHNFCGYGDYCKFSHAVRRGNRDLKNQGLDSKPFDDHLEQNGDDSRNSGQRYSKRDQQYGAPGKTKKPMCRYIRRGECMHGDRCKFYHPPGNVMDNVTNNLSDVKISKDTAEVSADVNKPQRHGYQHRRTPIYARCGGPQYIFTVADLNEEEFLKLRQRELDQLQKRYPQAEAFVDAKGRDGFQLTFLPTDPDWPYDVKHLKMILLFPAEYPKKRLQVKLAEDEQVPDTVKRQVWFGMQDWLRSRFARLAENGQVELVFKPLLKLLDRSLEDLFTEGLKLYKKELVAKASGIELVSASVLNDTYNQSSDDEDEEEGDTGDEETDTEEDDSEYEDEEEDEEEEEEEDDTPTLYPPGTTLDPAKKGIEVKLQHLQLKESAATLRVYFAKLTVQCARCRNVGEVCMPTDRATIVKCTKCHDEQLLQLRPGIAHQFSSIIGYLDAENCYPVDLILADCHFVIGCLNCGNDNKIEGLPHGQLKTFWCACHKKLTVSVESTRFTQLRPSDLLNRRGALVVKDKSSRQKKDPSIREGKPLPAFGTCKHYKKSFRWLRFPCCGKTYPCDECHDETEDHDMQFANRMLCGFCAKEQAFASNRECVMCGSNMTKKATSHWEGGKGCRDTVKMSRGDNKKYVNINKTASKKSQAKTSNGAKKTKLRHA